MNRRTWLRAGLVLLVFVSVAQANAGTPLMWAGVLHLMIGNLFIGVLEGLLLAKLFRLSSLGRAAGLLIAANYFSAWIGGVVILGQISTILPIDITNVWPMFWLLVAIAYLITIAFEFPFVAFAFRGKNDWLPRSIKASLIIQTVSCSLLFGWYWLASGTSLLTDIQVVASEAISVPDGIVMYYISAADGDVYSRRLGERDSRAVFDLNSTHWDDRLYVRPSSVKKTSWDLLARLEVEHDREPHLLPIRESFASVVAVTERDRDTDFSPEGTWFNIGPIRRLGGARDSDWEFWAGFWAMEGIRGSNKTTNETTRLSLETPFMAWRVRNATHLPTDKVLLQLGEDQICLYDPIQKQIALLVKGRGPVAVMEVDPRNTPATAPTSSPVE